MKRVISILLVIVLTLSFFTVVATERVSPDPSKQFEKIFITIMEPDFANGRECLECNSSRCNPHSMWPDLVWDCETYYYAYCMWDVTCDRDYWGSINYMPVKMPIKG